MLVVKVRAQISGHVYDDSGKPLSGVTISLKHHVKSVQSDENGRFDLGNVPLPDSLVARYMGFGVYKELLSSPKTRLKIIMERRQQSFGEVEIVHTGFYQASKEHANRQPFHSDQYAHHPIWRRIP